VHRDIAPLPIDGATQVPIALTVDNPAPLELGINGVAFKNAAPLMANVGDTEVWTVTNTFEFAHPFHMHGFFFQVLTNDDPPVPVAPLEWKDTVNIPVNGTVKFVVRYDDRPGMWMFHCHILDHAEAGMMGTLMLMEPP